MLTTWQKFAWLRPGLVVPHGLYEILSVPQSAYMLLSKGKKEFGEYVCICTRREAICVALPEHHYEHCIPLP